MNSIQEILTIQQLVNNIYQWGVDRNITPEGGATAQRQFSKTAEEVIELAIAWGKYDQSEGEDAIGDIIVTLIQGFRIDGLTAETLRTIIEATENYYSIGVGVPTVGKQLELINAELIDMVSTPGFASGYSVNLLVSILGRLRNVASDGFYTNFQHCLTRSWGAIKDRKGTMIDGKFVKENPDG